MNQYPAWKYLLISLALIVGVVYALPNLFGEDPALQITSDRGSAIPLDLDANIEDALVVETIEFKNKERAGNRMLYRFNSTEDQLRASDVIKQALGEQYVVALNLAHATPTWLRAFGGKPMTLGLDLQGGVHFLMQVDMDTARSQQLDRYVDDLRSALRDERIRYVSVRREGNGLLALLRSVEDRSSALELIRKDQSLQGLNVSELDTEEYFGISATVREQQLLELQQTALKQNINTLRNRVNEIGVAEPVIQQQGADRVVVQLPGVQDTVDAKKIIGATATLEYRAVDEANDAFTAAQTGRIPPESRMYTDTGGQPILLKKRLIVAGDQLIGANSGFDQQTGQPQVSVTLDGVGAKRMLDFTRENVGNRLAVVHLEQTPGCRNPEQLIHVAVGRAPRRGRCAFRGARRAGVRRSCCPTASATTSWTPPHPKPKKPRMVARSLTQDSRGKPMCRGAPLAREEAKLPSRSAAVAGYSKGRRRSLRVQRRQRRCIGAWASRRVLSPAPRSLENRRPIGHDVYRLRGPWPTHPEVDYEAIP